MRKNSYRCDSYTPVQVQQETFAFSLLISFRYHGEKQANEQTNEKNGSARKRRDFEELFYSMDTIDGV